MVNVFHKVGRSEAGIIMALSLFLLCIGNILVEAQPGQLQGKIYWLLYIISGPVFVPRRAGIIQLIKIDKKNV